MQKRKWFLCLFLLLTLCSGMGLYVTAKNSEETPGEAPPGTDLYAASALLMDADSGRILYEKNGYEIMPMASTTKIMTCIIALEYGHLEDEVTVTPNAAKQPKVRLGMRAEETYYLSDLLYSLMLESHNDTAVAIAEHVGGSVEEFAALMNQKARDIGAFQTNFVTPNGLDADGHQTTAAELALITRYCIQNEQFREIIKTPDHAFSTIDGGRSFTVANKDQFLHQMDGAFGVKTGFTNKAGYCFVGALERDGRTYISVVLASGWPPNKSWKWADTQELMAYGLDHYQYQVLFSTQPSFAQVAVEKGLSDTVDTYINGDLEMLVSAWDAVEVKYDYQEIVTAPVEKNQAIGFAVVTLNNDEIAKYPIKTKASVAKKDFQYWLHYVIHCYLYF